jgi:ubiquinone/menaquinone biosynthesis C-methylase UbiE
MTGPLLQRQQYMKGGIGRWYWDYRDRRALSYIREEKSILDIGCGEGITLEKLLKRFPKQKIQGLDYSPEKVKICERYHLPVRQGNAGELNYGDSSMDCCLLLEVVEHLAEPENALKEIYRVLHPGGLFLLIFPNDFVFKIARLGFLKFKEAGSPSGHVKQWTPSAMSQVLKKIGFTIQEMTCLPINFWPLSLHCLVVARKK